MAEIDPDSILDWTEDQENEEWDPPWPLIVVISLAIALGTISFYINVHEKVDRVKSWVKK